MSPKPGLALGHVQAALDASCAALIALEQARGEMTAVDAELARSQQAEAEAIELVRTAIAELRRHTVRGVLNPLSLGFVRAAPEPGEAA